jgi:hypothetical protein
MLSWRGEQPDRIQFLHLFLYMALPEGRIDHRRLDVGVAKYLHDVEGIDSRHGHLRPKGQDA